MARPWELFRLARTWFRLYPEQPTPSATSITIWISTALTTLSAFKSLRAAAKPRASLIMSCTSATVMLPSCCALHGLYVNPSCDTENALPPIAIVPVRAFAERFGATEYFTVPLPVPEAPELTVRKLALLTAVHEAVCNVESTFTLPVPPPAVPFAEYALKVNGLMTVRYTGTVM